jgi:hypothetical protein
MYTAFRYISEDFMKFSNICEQEIIAPKVLYLNTIIPINPCWIRKPKTIILIPKETAKMAPLR